VNGGEAVRTAGSSHLRFDAAERIILHRDFWDAAQGFYERIPESSRSVAE
jgi:steroid Delta-isomerase